jgi:hypothetical protein
MRRNYKEIRQYNKNSREKSEREGKSTKKKKESSR